eukprot:PhF_6_TR42764/c0_g1_i1/m.64680
MTLLTTSSSLVTGVVNPHPPSPRRDKSHAPSPWDQWLHPSTPKWSWPWVITFTTVECPPMSMTRDSRKPLRMCTRQPPCRHRGTWSQVTTTTLATSPLRSHTPSTTSVGASRIITTPSLSHCHSTE